MNVCLRGRTILLSLCLICDRMRLMDTGMANEERRQGAFVFRFCFRFELIIPSFIYFEEHEFMGAHWQIQSLYRPCFQFKFQFPQFVPEFPGRKRTVLHLHSYIHRYGNNGHKRRQRHWRHVKVSCVSRQRQRQCEREREITCNWIDAEAGCRMQQNWRVRVERKAQLKKGKQLPWTH